MMKSSIVVLPSFFDFGNDESGSHSTCDLEHIREEAVACPDFCCIEYRDRELTWIRSKIDVDRLPDKVCNHLQAILILANESMRMSTTIPPALRVNPVAS